MIGKVKWYDAQKGYGFITPAGSGADIFVHRSGLARTAAVISALQPGDEVTFFTQLPTAPPSSMNAHAPRACAVDVIVTKSAPRRSPSPTTFNSKLTRACHADRW